jgi:hypothetical protein
MTPVPLAKIPVREAVPPAVIDAGFAFKLVMAGAAGFTVTTEVKVAVAPAALVTVSV